MPFPSQTPAMNPPRLPGSTTTWSLAALVAGTLLGVIGNATEGAAFDALAKGLEPIGSLWTAALQMAVLPLVVFQLLAAILGVRGSVGQLAGRTLLLFLAMLVATAAFTLLVAPPLIESLPAGSLAGSVGSSPAPPESLSFGEWVAGLLPRNLVTAALEGELLPILLFTALLAAAIRRLPDEQRGPLTRASRGLADAMLTVVRWIIWFAPLGVFALIFVLAESTGLETAGTFGAFVLISCAVLLAATLLLYPVSALFGRVSIVRFARGVAPAQLVAVSTRSSIASLPALVEGGRDRLRLPLSATGFVLPFSVSVFKINRTLSAPLKLLFLSHVYGIPVTPTTLATFMVAALILSFSTSGTPGTGPISTMPVYLAAGMPIEGLVILEALDVIPDIFKTVFNVTGDMSAATILSRDSRLVGGAPAAEPMPDAA
jgi:proton glutamate symport protein